MWKLWLIFDPRRALIAVLVFAFAMVLFMHFIMLSTERFNFLGGATAEESASISAPANVSRMT